MSARRLRAAAACALALLTAAGSARAAGGAEGALELDARWAVDLHGGRSSALELLAWPELTLAGPGGSKLHALGRARMDWADELAPGRGSADGYARATRPLFAGRRFDAELRELYLDFDLGASALRVGKQQLVWGKADAVKILDALDPQSFREFVIDDFEDSRIPLWALSAERRLGPLDVRALWLPDPTVHELPARGARFAPTSPLLVPAFPAGAPLRLLPARYPRRALADSDAGLRVGGFARGWDWTLHALYQYDDTPVFERRAPRAPGAPLEVQPRYLRSPLLGASASRSAGNWVVRGELGFAPRRGLSVNDPREPDGVARTAELSHVLGLDWYGLRDTLLSAQLAQRRLGRSLDGVARDRTESLLSLLLRRSFLNEALSLELLALHSVNRADGLVRARLRYRARDDLVLWLGVDAFYGAREGLFGQFGRADRILAGAELRL